MSHICLSPSSIFKLFWYVLFILTFAQLLAEMVLITLSNSFNYNISVLFLFTQSYAFSRSINGHIHSFSHWDTSPQSYAMRKFDLHIHVHSWNEIAYPSFFNHSLTKFLSNYTQQIYATIILVFMSFTVLLVNGDNYSLSLIT